MQSPSLHYHLYQSSQTYAVRNTENEIVGSIIVVDHTASPSCDSAMGDRQSSSFVGNDGEIMEDNHYATSAIDGKPTESSSYRDDEPISRTMTEVKSHRQPSVAVSESSKTEQAAEVVRFKEYQVEIWSDKFKELCMFRKFHGHSHVPHHYSHNLGLANWVKRQRYQYRLKISGKRSTLTEERIRMLNGVDFVWSSHDAIWEERFQQILAYKKAHGDCVVPSVFDENPSLGIWTKRQRRQYKNYQKGLPSSMTESRIAKLEKIGFVWNCHNTSNSREDSADDRLQRHNSVATTENPLPKREAKTLDARNIVQTSFVRITRRGDGVPTATTLLISPPCLSKNNINLPNSTENNNPRVAADSSEAMSDDLHLSCCDSSCECDLSINTDIFMDD